MIKGQALSREQVVDDLELYCAGTDTTYSDVAKAIGQSVGRFSAWKAGTYKGNMEITTKAVAQYLETRNQQREERTAESTFAETKQSQDIMSVVNFCQVKRKMGLVHGPSGVGKTTTLRHLMETNSHVLLITAFSRINQSELLSELLISLGRAPKRQSKTRLLQRIKYELSNSTRVIVVDEAQKCGFEVLETLRHLWDVTGVGIVFVGTDDVVDRMKGRAKTDYDQIYSRLAIKLKLEKKVVPDDVKKVLEASGVSIAKNGLLKFACELAKRQGHFRTLSNHIEMAVELARERGAHSGAGVLPVIALEDFKNAGRMLWSED